VRAKVAMDFTQDKYSAPRTNEKMKILGAILELPAKQPIYHKTGPNWPNQQCCLAGFLFFQLLWVSNINF
jgi:hypothetical protein